MALSWKHHFVTSKAEGTDSSIVGPNEWNEGHDAVTDTVSGMVVGRDNTGAGPLQELPAVWDPVKRLWAFITTGGLNLGAGTTAQRPAGVADGTLRWNSTLGMLEYVQAGVWKQVQALLGPHVSDIPVGGTLGWYSNTVPTGFLFVNGQTIGSAASSADKKSADYQNLFTFLWDNLSNAVAPVIPSRGTTTALDDWNNNRKITLPDECGRVSAGMDTMGGVTSKARLDKVANSLGPSGIVLGDSGGEALHKLLIPELAKHHHTVPALSTLSNGIVNTSGGGANDDPPTSQDTGEDKPHNTVQPTIIKNVIIKY